MSGKHPNAVVTCRHCGAPNDISDTWIIPDDARHEFPLGPNGGVMIRRRVPGTDEWIEIEHFPPGDESDDFVVVDPIVPLKIAAVILNLAPKTLYTKAHNLGSAQRVAGRWIFKRELLYAVDLEGESEFPTRKEELAERSRRSSLGEVLRPGPHTTGCSRDHRGPCRASRRPSPSTRPFKRRRSW